MPHDKFDPSRRVLLCASAGGLVALAGCGSGTVVDRQLRFATLAQAEAELVRLSAARPRTGHAAWSWAQTLVHCAQSIEYSMIGYPEARSRVFQATLGQAAFAVFAWRGRMTHDLAEPIPGAPPLADEADEARALERLQRSIREFRAWRGPLRPHFAYGDLDAAGYELAHAMHMANHLSFFGGLPGQP